MTSRWRPTTRATALTGTRPSGSLTSGDCRYAYKHRRRRPAMRTPALPLEVEARFDYLVLAGIVQDADVVDGDLPFEVSLQQERQQLARDVVLEIGRQVYGREPALGGVTVHYTGRNCGTLRP